MWDKSASDPKNVGISEQVVTGVLRAQSSVDTSSKPGVRLAFAVCDCGLNVSKLSWSARATWQSVSIPSIIIPTTAVCPCFHELFYHENDGQGDLLQIFVSDVQQDVASADSRVLWVNDLGMNERSLYIRSFL